jgi:ubiquinone/menaquinone biosynthesis C-methylase UbiE
MENSCPVCKHSDFRMIGIPDVGTKVEKIIKHKYSVVQCNNCKFYYIDPAINFSQEEWEYLYDENYFPRHTSWYYKQRKSDRITRFDTLQRFSSIKIDKFLDIGCGEGDTLSEAVRRGWESYGLDIQDHRTEENKKNNKNFIKGNLFDVSLPNDYFDIIFLDSVLEHVTNPLEYLNEIYRILKAGGIAYIGIPNEDSMLNDFRKIIFNIIGKNKKSEKLMPFKSPYHIGGFNSLSINYIVKETDFRTKLKRNFGCRLEFLKYPFLSKDYLIAFLFFPINLLAIPFNREVYFELYIEKPVS